MRMWNVDPKKMCRKHLFGEHVEMHMAIGALKKGKSIKGFIDKGLLEVHNIVNRHDILAYEIKRRGYNHKSPLVYDKLYIEGKVHTQENIKELCNRCKECRSMFKKEISYEQSS
jgi:hypothetical protein